MSVIIKDGDVYKIYVKGADNVIKDRLAQGEQKYLENAIKKLEEFSLVGLRTLMQGMAILSEDEVRVFKEGYNNLATSQNKEKDTGNIIIH